MVGESHKMEFGGPWSEASRRKSYHLGQKYDNLMKIDTRNSKNGGGRLKNIETIYQESNSGYSTSQIKDNNNPSFFKRERDEHQKSYAQTPIPEKKRGEFESISVEGEEKVVDKINLDEIRVNLDAISKKTEERKDNSLAEFSTARLQKKDTDHMSVQTPKSKKLDVHLTSTPIQPKILDVGFDFVEKEADPSKKKDSSEIKFFEPRKDENMTESILVRRSFKFDGKDIINSVLDIQQVGFQKSFPRQSRGSSPLPIQHLTEQIETLASETMKIIDEIRNKKRGTIISTNEIQ